MLNINTGISSPIRQVKGKVELYNGSTLSKTFAYNDILKSIDITRVGDNTRFFGYGISQKLNFHLRDVDRAINVTTANRAKVAFSADSEYIYNFPTFSVTETHRDENTNELSITAYDALYWATEHTVAELGLEAYTVQEFASACATLLGATGLIISGVGSAETCFNTSYPEGANFEGTETIREALNAVAEVTQTVYYLDYADRLVFKRLAVEDTFVLPIGKSQYITLESRTNRRLSAITHITELGDNVTASAIFTGTTQFIRDNPFWELRDDIGTLVDNALAAAGGLTMAQFSCSWRGNFLLEIGDKVALQDKENGTIYAFIVDDVISYNGGLSEVTKWEYTESTNEATSTPTTLGESLKQTYARVDKANKQIELVASDIDTNKSNIASLILSTDSISGTVADLSSTVNDVTGEITELAQTVETKVSAEDVKLEIREELSNGVDKVTTATGFTFNEEGLTVSKTGTEMATTITENGMTVYKDNTEVLTANNKGVIAIDLHATTYLIVGNNSRFEDYEKDGEARTGCFWIGG